MKKFLLLTLFICLPCSVWAVEKKISPGLIIDNKNYKHYLPELKKLIIPSNFNIIKKGLDKGLITIPVVQKKKYSLPAGFSVATKKNYGKLTVGKDNRLIGQW
ncbi:MAG: hypothetical protein SV062_01260, partial [Thermodesulfobacteriota bacterium]|nr:hypothetical protein [Thermodesulfobacteriota bacterium]